MLPLPLPPQANRPASMRPRSIDRGNPESPETLAIQLQASMRPRSIDRGNTCDDGNDNAIYTASMRPRSIDRGNAHLLRGLRPNLLASMRPRSIDRGNSRPPNYSIVKDLRGHPRAPRCVASAQPLQQHPPVLLKPFKAAIYMLASGSRLCGVTSPLACHLVTNTGYSGTLPSMYCASSRACTSSMRRYDSRYSNSGCVTSVSIRDS